MYFYDPKLRRYSAIPYSDTSRPAISLWELREIKQQLEKEGKENVDEGLISEAYEKMRAQEERAIRETKRVRRTNQRRAMHNQATPPKTAEEYPPVDDGEFQRPPSVSDIAPFDEMEEVA